MKGRSARLIGLAFAWLTALTALTALMALTAACAPWRPPAWQPGMPLDERCEATQTEEAFEALSRTMTTWLDGELTLHALSPSSIEELTNAPIARGAEELIWSYRFTPEPFPHGEEPAPPIDHAGYPLPRTFRSQNASGQFLSMRVVTRERVYKTPDYLFLGDEARLLDRSFYPTQLGYRGSFFNGDPSLHEYSAETRERGFGFLFPSFEAPPGGEDRVELTAKVALAYYRGQHNQGACTAMARATLPLPAGPTLWDRLNRLFLAGPIKLKGGALASPPPQVTGGSNEPVLATPEAACEAGASEGCYSAGSALLKPKAPAPKDKSAAPRDPSPPRPEDLAAAREFLHRGCDLGHGPSCGGYAALLRAGASPDSSNARPFFQRACKLDFGDGCTELGRDAERRGDRAKARELFALGCQLGSGAGCFWQAHFNEGGGPEHEEKQARLYEKSCVYGVPVACVYYSAVAARLRDLTPWRKQEGYYLACGAGLSWACNALGLYHAGLLESREEGASAEKVKQAFARACALGAEDGCKNGRAFEAGQPLPRLTPPPTSLLPAL